jgi:hypothetical protein
MAHTHNTPTQSSDGATTPAALAASVTKVTSPTPALAEAIAAGYEPRDIGVRGVVYFLAGIVVSLAVVSAVIYGIMMALVAYDRSHDPTQSPLSVRMPVSTAPPLQPSVQHENVDTLDMKEMRQIVDAQLSTDGVSAFHHRRHIPIDQAIDKVLPLLKQMKNTEPPAPKKPSIFTSDETTGPTSVPAK